MQYLTGTYTATLDDKNRISLPAPMRKYFEERCLNENTFYITEGFEIVEESKRSLKLYTVAQYNEMVNDLMKGTNIFSTKDENLRLHILGSSNEVCMDKAGRIPIPQTHLEFAGLSKNCLFFGQGDHIAIWDEDRFYSYKKAEATNEQFAVALEELSQNMKTKGLN